MRPLDVASVIEATGARAPENAADARFTDVCTDSRAVSPGSLFVALRGPNFDGNAYALDALAAGAAGALFASGRGPTPAELSARGLEGRACLEHPEPELALTRLAAWYRRRFSIPVVGITGSCGKTTTKDITGHVLGRFVPTVASRKSFNNSIGVPATLFRIEDATGAAVVEIGTNARGEIAALSEIAAPTIGIVTNVAEAHLSGLGSIEGVAREKGDLVAALPPDGVAILNADCRFHRGMAERARCRVVTFALDAAADLTATDVVFHAAGTSFRVGGRPATVPLLGTHNVYNALAAIAAAEAVGVPLERALGALGDLPAPERRLERKRFGDVEVLDDCYNANPASTRAAIRALEGLRVGRRRMFVLGSMRELGDLSKALHRDVGRAVGAAKLDVLVAVGDEAGEIVAGAVEGGMSAARVVRFPTTGEAAAGIGDLAKPGDLILVKGSRAEGLERVVEALRAAFDRPAQAIA